MCYFNIVNFNIVNYMIIYLVIMDEYFVNFNKEYEQKINQINLNIKKKNFKHKIEKQQINIEQLTLDDMSDVLYTKNYQLNYKYCNYNIDFTDDIIKDVSKLLKTLNYDYFDDTIFKKVSKINELNRFNPKTEDEIIFYNCLKRDIFTQPEFRNHIFMFEDKLKKINKHHNKDCSIMFFEDDDLKIIWFIVTVV